VSKPIEQLLLVPGESGWQIWTRLGTDGFTLHESTAHSQAGALENLPAGEVTMLFPVKAVTAVPMRVTSDDDALFPDLATLHAERLGLRPDPMAGQLSDLFVVARDATGAALLSVFLRPPEEGDLPSRGPTGFDISARAYPAEGDILAIWIEFGRWVFAVFQQGKLAYCQATAVDQAMPTAALAREIRLSMMQLAMQGLHCEPQRLVVWGDPETIDTESVQAVFGIPTTVSPRPVPMLPQPLSKLLPADVRAARKEATRRRRIVFAAAAVAVAYLGLVAWLVTELVLSSAATRKLFAKANEIAPESENYAQHISKWDELAHAIDLTHSPVDILHRVASCIPPGSGLRIKSAAITANEIKLIGETPQFDAVNSFSLQLSRHNGLLHYKWQPPAKNNTNRGWEFVLTAEVPTTDIQP
jgi:hypothetical protein